MFAQRLVASFKKPFDWFDYAYHKSVQGKEKRSKKRIDLVAEQVKKVLKTSDQKLILMVRG